MSQVPKATYYRCPWSSVVGTGVFRKHADQPNNFLIIKVVLPKAEAEETADAIVEMMTQREAGSGRQWETPQHRRAHRRRKREPNGRSECKVSILR